jgi:hypothetical protein
MKKEYIYLAALIAGIGMSFEVIPGVSNTKHNLGTGGTGNNRLSSGTAEVCVFCHTPHGSNTGATVPLWNKGFTNTGSFSTYKTLGTSTLDAEELSVGSVSLACLSCHDGTQAMDNMVNAPGSGGYNATGASPAGYTWTGGATMTGSPIPMLGTDLRNDHPIGIAYCGGWTTAPTGVITASSDCKDKDFKDSSYSLINGNAVWWVDTTADGAAGVRGKQDIILYTRTFGVGVGPSVECASCHDPHVEAKATNEVSFLRVSQSGSGVCLACHVK